MSSTEDLSREGAETHPNLYLIREGEHVLKHQAETHPNLYLSFIVKVLIHWLRRSL